MGCVLMVKAMAGDEGDRNWFAGGRRGVFEDVDWRGRNAPRGGGPDGGCVVEIRESGKAGATDHGY